MLVAAKADVNTQDKNGYTALMHAVCQRQIKAVEELIESDCDVNLKSWSGITVSNCFLSWSRFNGKKLLKVLDD